MTNRKAATTRLEPGEHSIDRVSKKDLPGGKVRIEWSVRLHDGRLVPGIRTQGDTLGEVRRKAKAKAAELLAQAGTDGTWKQGSKLTDYVEKVSRPAVESAKLRENSKVRYRIVLDLLVGKCNSEDHRHANSLKGHSIASGTTFRALEKCLQEIGRLHGGETARQARNVLGRYVLQQLKRDGLIVASPIAGETLDLGQHGNPRTRGGQSLTRDQRNAVIDHLLDLDPADGVVKRQGRWPLEALIAKRANIIDLTLLQASTGLRVGEANLLEWRDVEVADDGQMHVHVREEVSKTHKARRVPVLDAAVATRILERQNAAGGRGYVIGSPADQGQPWDRDNCRKTAADFYGQLGHDLEIPLLATARTHVWRATLNTLMIDVPEVIRSAFFGHDETVNRASYTDLTDTSTMITAAKRLRAV